MDITAHKGGEVMYHDPHIPAIKTNEGRQYKSDELNKERLEVADVVVLTTNHSAFKIKFI